MELYIAEKPSVAKSLIEYFNKHGANFKYGKGCAVDKDKNSTVTWAAGHLMALVDPEVYDENWKYWDSLPVIPPNLSFKKYAKKSTIAQFNIVQGLLKDATTVINVGDPDREGQLLIDELIAVNPSPRYKIKRILLNALDDKSIKSALADMKDNEQFKSLSESAEARACADWLVGMNLTRLYTTASRKGGWREVFNVGRVMSPTLALIVAREREIRNFKEQKFWTATPVFQIDGKEIVASYIPNKKYEQEKDALLQQAQYQKTEATVSKVEKKTVQQEVKELYSMDSLQIEASKKFGFSPQQTADILQTLYEKKVTSYPRSDCKYLPTSQFQDALPILDHLEEYLQKTLPKPSESHYQDLPLPFNDKKITAHHAIVPTLKAVSELSDADQLTDNELKLYQLIAEKYASMFYPPFTYNQEIITLTGKDNTQLQINIKNIIDYGWKNIIQDIDETPDEDSVEGAFTIQEGDRFIIDHIKVKAGKTKAPKRYTSGTIIQAMTNISSEDKELAKILKQVKGIGTPATRSGIIDKLITYNLIAEEKKHLIPTAKGEFLYDVLPNELKNAEYTALMELELDKIIEGSETVQSVLNQYQSFVVSVIDYIHHTNSLDFTDKRYSCPICQKGYLHAKVNPETKSTYFKCNNTDCNTYISSKPIHSKKDLPIPEYYSCPNCDGILTRKKGKTSDFFGCSNYSSGCKTTFSTAEEAKAGKKIEKQNNKN